MYVEGITIALRGGEEGEGEITGYVNIRRDISGRKWAEERVEESRRQSAAGLPATSMMSPSRSSQMPWSKHGRSTRYLRTLSRPSGSCTCSQPSIR